MDFEINLEKTEINAGNKLRGTILVKSNKFSKEKFDFSIVGEELVSILVNKPGVHRDKRTSPTKTLRERTVIYNEDLGNLLNQSTQNNQLSFELPIPTNILPTYKGRNVSINYHIVGKIKKFLGKRNTIQINMHNSQHAKPTHPIRKHDEKQCFAQIIIPKKNYTPGETIRGKIIITKDVEKIKEIELILQGIESATACGHSATSIVQKFTKKLRITNEGDTTFEIMIPHEAQASFQASHSSYSWELEAKYHRRLKRDFNDYDYLVIG